ncbi:MAG: methyltransferase domain-containing protein, partial [Planctomycetales bacterium]|nr:methyltransferase domain-containing protein [Planctomycetales bacterium]
MSKDRIYALPRSRVGDFRFDNSVVDVFPDMIARSVPGYGSILSMIEQLGARYIRPNTNVYDLGCSLGAATKLLRRQAPQSATIHAVDNSSAMIEKLSEKLNASPPENQCNVEVHNADIRELPMQNASLIVLNLTLQFVPAEQRSALLQNCCDALLSGGALLLSEK